MRRLLSLGLVLLIALGVVLPAGSQGPGLFVRSDCTTITSPVTGQTWCFDSTNNVLKFWSGSAFTTYPTATTPISIGTARVTYVSATSIQLGQGVIPLDVAGTWIMRPVTAAITISNTGLVASTTYFVYAYDASGTTTLFLSTTGHTTNASFGVEVYNGSTGVCTPGAYCTLVGMIRTEGSTPGQFVNSATQRFTVSYFARRAIGLVNNFTANRTTTVVTYVELNTEIRCEFVTWADEAVLVGTNSINTNSGTNNNYTAVGFDGTNQENAVAAAPALATGTNGTVMLVKNGLAEGYHYVTFLGAVTAGTGTWYGAAYVADTTVRNMNSLSVEIRG